jgi:hypothetical protein
MSIEDIFQVRGRVTQPLAIDRVALLIELGACDVNFDFVTPPVHVGLDFDGSDLRRRSRNLCQLSRFVQRLELCSVEQFNLVRVLLVGAEE